ncbi:hypothetical protein C8Q78DRAFT_1069973 [Trametes maxima]|nr:hypothetical protein C8Q78DRAFT_1069973 [Trametes maxima]
MHFLSLASIALVASGASAIAIPRSHVAHARNEKPATYYEGYLEPYDTYHTRYLAIDCESQHNTPFFDACCHPMLATETLAKNRAPECNPANHVSSSVSATHAASSAQATATQVLSTGGDDDDEDCDDEDDEPTSTASSAAPTATDEDDEDCDDEDDEPSSSAAPSSTHHSSTPAPETTASPTHSATPSSTPSSTPKPSTSTHSATPTKTAAPTKSTAAPAETSAASSDKAGIPALAHYQALTHEISATFYFQGGQAGACGAVNPDSAFIAAMQTKRYGDLGAKSALCGQKVQITNKKNGKSVTVTIADACPTCGTENDIDLSQGAFDQIATEEEGEVPITWHFV